MRQSDQMLEFIDGTLGSDGEQELFEQLAAQPELRTELRDYVQIGEAVRADREAFTPPADVERRLLGGLGLLPFGTAAAGAGGAAGTAAGGFAAASLLKGGLLPLLTGFLLGALLVGGGVWYALGDDGEGESRESIAAAVETGSTIDPSWIEPESARAPEFFGTGAVHAIPRLKSDAAAVRVVRQVRPAQVQSGVSSLSVSDGQVNPTSTSPETIRAAVELTPSQPIVAPAAVNDPDAIRSESRSNNPASPVSSPDFSPRPLVFETEPYERKPSVALGYRALLLNDPIVDNEARQMTRGGLDESFVAGGYYLASDVWQVGVEVGRERYAQSFFYNREDSIVIEQRPLLGWGGLSARFETDLLPVPVQIGTTLGFSEHGGPVARGLVSLDLLDIFPVIESGRFRLPVGFEASSLVYTFNDQYFVAGNWGLSGGIQVGF